MGAPRFVHLRLHSEYSVTDGIVRIDDAVERARDDGMPALALTDAANVFGMVKFYRAARAAGVKPVIGVDCWLQNETDRDKPFRILLLCASRAGYLRLCDLLSRAWLKNQHRGAGEIARAWLEEQGATEGLIALSGAAGGDVGQALLGDHAEAAERLAEGWARAFPGPLLPRAAARRPPASRSAGRAHGGARLAAGPAGGRHAPGAVPRRRATSRRTKRASASPRPRARRPAPAEALHARAVLQARRTRWRSCSPTSRRRCENSIEIARRCNLSIELGKSRLPAFPTPDGVTIDELLWQRGRIRAGPTLREARPQGRAISRAIASGSRSRSDHRADGLRRLLPDRRRLHQLGASRTACRWGPGAARARARWSPTRSASPTSTRSSTTCCSSASSTRSACRCRTSTSTSARTGATA